MQILQERAAREATRLVRHGLYVATRPTAPDRHPIGADRTAAA